MTTTVGCLHYSKLSAGLSVFGPYQLQQQHMYGMLEQSTGPIFMPDRTNLPPVHRERSTSAPNVSYNIVQGADRVPTFQVHVAPSLVALLHGTCTFVFGTTPRSVNCHNLFLR